MHYKNEVINQQCVKNTRFSIKQQLQKKKIMLSITHNDVLIQHNTF